MNPSFDPSQLPLRDIHLPGAITWWPPAVGWWLLAAALLGVVIGFAVWTWRHRRHRAACRALGDILAALQTGADPSQCAQRASIVLRRFAMTTDDDSPRVAGLVGERWLEYLGHLGRDAELATGHGRLLLDAPYCAPERVTQEQALELCRLCLDWVKSRPGRA